MAGQVGLSLIARAGFEDLSQGRLFVESLCSLTGAIPTEVVEFFASTADPTRAAKEFFNLEKAQPVLIKPFLRDAVALQRLLKVLGGSQGLSDFLLRNPHALQSLRSGLEVLPDSAFYALRMCASVGAVQDEDGYCIAATGGEAGRLAMRIAYREQLLRIAAFDLCSQDATLVVDEVARALADLAGAAIEASLALARLDLQQDFLPRDIENVLFSVIGMGKCGARELNYLSDVDVIYVGQSRDKDVLSTEKALAIATRMAHHTMRGIFELESEPGLWEVDANLRPEGKDGALVRTLESHLAYYDRWAKNWEFQALLKARPIAGSVSLGKSYMAGVAPKVWSSASRPGFVDQVQRMRERVTDNIPASEVEWQLKLGPGGLRDIEFTVQLLQLVHGQNDDTLRLPGTTESLVALSAGGYVGRSESASFASNYRLLRVLEHRLQLRDLTRTHLFPRQAVDQRILARASGLATNEDVLLERWQGVKRDVRGLHERLFYRPLLNAVANLSDDNHQLTVEQAQDRLLAIGFTDAKGALGHIAALTSGLSRRATIQKALLPVLLEWFAEGADPDNGLLAFRRLSEALGESHWYLRMIRDSAAAAQRLTQILSGSRFVTDLLERIPEAVAWLEDDSDLQPRTLEALDAEAHSLLSRHDDDESAVDAVRFMRRREVLRLAMAGISHIGTMAELSRGLTDITTASLRAFLTIAQRHSAQSVEFGIIAMGRYGGEELGFGSDADVMFVYRAGSGDSDIARRSAESVASLLIQYAADTRLALELDLDLRPEGKNGPTVRSLDSYRAYYERWSLTWEAQALLRAMPVAGNDKLLSDFLDLVNTVRFRDEVPETELREIRRIKARVESERLPQGADPSRHLKLGRGSISDVEWTIQLLQLQFGHLYEGLRTTSTIDAIEAAVSHSLLARDDADKLIHAWVLSSRIRSAMTLWAQRSSDVLPRDVHDLEGIARLLDLQRGQASLLEEQYLSTTRRARAVVERVFYSA